MAHDKNMFYAATQRAELILSMDGYFLFDSRYIFSICHINLSKCLISEFQIQSFTFFDFWTLFYVFCLSRGHRFVPENQFKTSGLFEQNKYFLEINANKM